MIKYEDLKCEFCNGAGTKERNDDGADVEYDCFFCDGTGIDKDQLLTLKQFNMKKIYYARPINLYGTNQDKRDIELIESIGFELVNPNKEELQKRYSKEGMDVFLAVITECDGLAFRAFPDGKISAGVQKEILKALELKKIVFELPTITSHRVLSVDDTREYLKLLGR